MVSAGGPEPVRFPLRRGWGAVVLHESGFRHPRGHWWPAETFTAYADVTHLELGPRMVRIGTRAGVFWLRRPDFAEPDAPENLVRALLARIAAGPGGREQLARMAEIEELARAARPPRATLLLAAACAGVFALQRLLGPVVVHATFFGRSLVSEGEHWRLLTANLAHGLPGDGALGWVHFTLNMVGLLGVGALVELPLAGLRTAFVMGLAALGAMGAGWLAGYEWAVGASGVVSGLAGAALWLELRRADHLPAGWRVPRRAFLAVLVGNALLPLVVPIVAGAAHLGGFAAGFVGAALVATPRLRLDPPGLGVVLGDALLGLVAMSAFSGAAPLVMGDPQAWTAHAERLLVLEQAPPDLLNNAAWIMATETRPDPVMLERALALAERAVEETGGRDPNVLDTLAEVLFQMGRVEEAVEVIDRAIALAPDEPYFREQRRRFLGERAPDDRPPPPDGPVLPPAPPEPGGSPEPEEPGIRV